jgi:hypothetical protein
MIYFPQNIQTRQVFSPEITFGHLSRKENATTLVKLNTCFSALESICIVLGNAKQDHDLVQHNTGLLHAIDRSYQLCERLNGKIQNFTKSIEAYLRSPTALWAEQKGFVVEQSDELRAYLKMFPWSELDSLVCRVNDDPETSRTYGNVCHRMPSVMSEVLNIMGNYYAPKENRL